MRKRTGLRNRMRTGRSTYSVRSKRLEADSYGVYQQGKQITPERVGGRTLSRPLRSVGEQ